MTAPSGPLSEAEARFLAHMCRWGSNGYPIQKVKRGWIWGEFCGVKGPLTVFKTKREAFAAVEQYIYILIDKKAGRL